MNIITKLNNVAKCFAGVIVSLAICIFLHLLAVGYMSGVPQTLTRRFTHGTAYHATSTRQCEFECDVCMKVFSQVLPRLKVLVHPESYANLECMQERWRIACENARNYLAHMDAMRVFIFANDNCAGYAYLVHKGDDAEWKIELIGNVCNEDKEDVDAL